MLHTVNRIFISASPDTIYVLAADILQWPDILPHYRYVRVIGTDSEAPTAGMRTVKMAASRTGIPVSWTSRQHMDPSRRSVQYQHVGGATKGMKVQWLIDPKRIGCEVSIVHDLDRPRWWLRPLPISLLVSRYFIETIAEKTLRGIKARAEVAEGHNKSP